MDDVVPVRWGFLGAGVMGSVLSSVVHAVDGAVLQAAGARDVARAAALGPVRAHAGYDAVLADPEVDAVYVALSNEAHLPWTLAALRAGKHVLCEKPLGLTADEVDAMAAVAAETGRRVVEASWYRWHPRVRDAQARLAEVGDVLHVSAGFTCSGVPAGSYRHEPARGGGALYDVGCYAVSACLWAVGQGLPDDVVARSRCAPAGVDLETDVLLSWESGVEADLRAGLDTADRQWLVISGTAGEIELRAAPFTAWDLESELWVSDGTGTERVRYPRLDPYRLMVEEVSSVLRGGPGWVLPLAESRRTAAVLDAARASAAAGSSAVRPA